MKTVRTVVNAVPSVALLITFSMAISNRALADETPHLNSTLKTYCISCHGKDKPKADIRLDTFAPTDTELAGEIVRVMSDGLMPPKGKPRPDDSLRKTVIGELQSLIDQDIADDSLSPVVMRRLNRYEYNNVVRDLLKLQGDIYPLTEKTIRARQPYFFPASGQMPDTVTVGCRPLGHNVLEPPMLSGVTPFAVDLQAEHGFNNRGSELGISPLLIESCLALSRSVVNSPEFNGYCDSYNTLFAYDGPDANSVARERITNLLHRAFRGKVDAATTNRYCDYFDGEFARTRSFETSMKATVAVALASPRFLYLVERKPQTTENAPKAVAPLSSMELATRLSFFLWSTIPDEELLAAAEQDDLRDPEKYVAQVNRMLGDPRSKALATNFARQWLRLDQLTTSTPDFDRFPTFYSKLGDEHWKLSALMMLEPLLLFETVMVEDRPIMELIDSDYAYRNKTLQTWYDDANAFADRGEERRYMLRQDRFTRRQLADRRQGGVITTAAVMTMTSTPIRTSPIVRGAWVAGVILNRPPKPPPDNIPDIEADEKDIAALGLTLRQRLEQHQENDSCRSCHAAIDPYGFALENYDSVGHWRDKYASGLPVDASGELFGRIPFKNVIEFKDALTSDPSVFYRAFSEHLFSYALGRKLRASDKPDIDRMVEQLLKDKGRFSSLIRSITTSTAFQSKVPS